MKSAGPLALFGLLEVLTLLAPPAASPQRSAASALQTKTVAGPSPYLPDCYGQQSGIPFLNSVVEPQAAADPGNPNHLVGVWQQDRWSTAGASGVLAAVSLDHGSSWTVSSAPFSICSGGSFERATDPWVTIALGGAAYQIDMPFNVSDGTHAILISRSADGGFTWSTPLTLVERNPSSIDKPTIAADPRQADFVYAVWTGQGGAAAMARSLDAGKTWSAPAAIFTPCGACAAYDNNVLVLPDGSVADVFIWYQPNASPYAITMSHDHGTTWSAPVVIATEQLAAAFVKPGPAIRSGGPGIAVDPKNGALYIAWEDARFGGMKIDGIAFSRSTDGGATWSAPRQVNQAPAAWAFNAGLAVAGNGAIGLTYYDLRNDIAGSTNILADYWQIESHDAGDTWTETHLAGPFDLTAGPIGEDGSYFLGDYEGLAAAGADFLAFFAATTPGGSPRTSRLFSTVVPQRTSGPHTVPRNRF